MSVAGRTRSGTVARTHAAPTAPIAAIAKKALCQPKVSPSQAEIGMPTTEAIDQPMKMKVIAPARCSGGVIAPIAAAACGVKTAAPRTVRARTGRSAAKLGIKAQSAWPIAYHASAAASSFLRSSAPTQPARSGAPKHITTAATATSWPATATDTASEREMSGSVPTGTMTPQPMTKLPNSSDQRTCARRCSLTAAPLPGRRPARARSRSRSRARSEQRPGDRLPAQWRTLSASGLTMLVGRPSTKLTTFSNAARK